MRCSIVLVIIIFLLLLLLAQDPERMRHWGVAFAGCWDATPPARLRRRWGVRRLRRQPAFILQPAGRRRLRPQRRMPRVIQEEGDPSPAEMVVQRSSLRMPSICRPIPARDPSPAEAMDGRSRSNLVQEQVGRCTYNAAREQGSKRAQADVGCCTCRAVEEQRGPNRAQIVVGLCNWVFPEPRNTLQEQGDPNPAQLVKMRPQ